MSETLTKAGRCPVCDTEIDMSDPKILENHALQMAAIMTATMQNTETTKRDRIDRTNPFWTQAYADVCVAIDREMKLRTELEQAKQEASGYRQRCIDGERELATATARAEKAERSKAAMRPFLAHKQHCCSSYEESACDCGLDAALDNAGSPFISVEELGPIREWCEQALSHLGDAGSASQHDPSWSHPMRLSPQEVQERCVQAYHCIHKALQSLITPKP